MAAEPRTPAGRWVGAALSSYGLLVLIVATVFGGLDRQILVLLAEPMRQSLQLTDTKLGLLQGAGITLLGGVAAVPLGWLADRYGRRSVLAASVLVWAVATAAFGMATDFPALLLAAAGMGIGEVGLSPIVFSLIPEIVSPRRRVLANGVYALAAIFGTGLGIALSGAMVHSLDALRPLLPAALQGLESWRLTFLAVALQGPLVALAVLLIRLHPQRASSQSASTATARPALRDYARAHLRCMVGVFGGSGLAGLGLAASGNWLPVIATRSFGADAAAVGQGMGAAYLLGTAAGAAMGALGMRLLGQRLGLALPMRVTAIGAGLAALAAGLMPLAPNMGTLYLLFGVQVMALIAGSVLMPTLLQDMAPVDLRSRLIAIASVVSVLLGALSPVLVGALSDLLSATPQGLLMAVTLVGALAFALAALLMKSAEQAVAATVQSIHPHLVRQDPI
ncbi:MFS transporter [Roseateles toxinivorans]|uniref:Fucose permease n=1 Tax=Roseateles toxinivorans TaxID=270368 RepID=A0A4V3CSV0_9BURK|nr:MFS transporter [Roseateles toxinivorans]TDP62094.1 fucose permease [Roseateles toxinivorans]